MTRSLIWRSNFVTHPVNGEMDTLHSLALLLALICGSLGGLLAIFLLFSSQIQRQVKVGPRACALVCAVLAFVFGILSAIVHFYFGHGADSMEPMDILSFIVNHKAYGMVLALSVLSFLGYFSVFYGSENGNFSDRS